MVIQLSLLTAFQLHPLCVVTVTLPPPPPAAKVWRSGEMEKRLVVAAVVVAALVAAAALAGSHPLGPDGAAPADRAAYCAPTAGMPVGHVCMMLG